jgi:hypothetical protein
MNLLVRVQAKSACRVVLLFVLLCIAGESLSAQSSSTAPGEGQNASSSADMLGSVSVKAPNPPDPGKQFSTALQVVEKRGRRTHFPDYMWNDLGMSNASMQPLGASFMEDVDSNRAIYLVDGSNTAVVIKGGMVYLATRSGVLKKAAQMKSGSHWSRSLQGVPLGPAVMSFNAERDFWIEQLAMKVPAKPPSK